MNGHEHDTRGPATDDFERRIRERLLERAEQLDGRTLSRLTQARHAALAELGARPRAFRVPGFWLPAGAVACAMVLATAVWLQAPGERPAAPVAQDVGFVEDLALLAAHDEPEMYADDPDFYEWADGMEDGTGGTRG